MVCVVLCRPSWLLFKAALTRACKFTKTSHIMWLPSMTDGYFDHTLLQPTFQPLDPEEGQIVAKKLVVETVPSKTLIYHTCMVTS